jgi:hypothetical protein
MALTTGMGMFDPLLDPLLGFGGGYDPFYTGGFGAPSTLGTTGTLAPGGAPTRAPFTVGAAGWTRSIPVDFIERENEYIVRADIPGVHRDELHVDTHDGNVLRFGCVFFFAFEKIQKNQPANTQLLTHHSPLPAKRRHNPNPERVTKDTEETGAFAIGKLQKKLPAIAQPLTHHSPLALLQTQARSGAPSA